MALCVKKQELGAATHRDFGLVERGTAVGRFCHRHAQQARLWVVFDDVGQSGRGQIRQALRFFRRSRGWRSHCVFRVKSPHLGLVYALFGRYHNYSRFRIARAN